MKRIACLFLFLSLSFVLSAQKFVGGRMNRSAVSPNGGIFVGVHTYTLDAGVPTIKIDWGDGQIEDIPSDGNAEVDNRLYWNYYDFFHVYEQSGDYTISYTDSFWVDGIVNLENSEEVYFHLEEQVHFSQGELPNSVINIVNPFPNHYFVLDDGSIDLGVNPVGSSEFNDVILRFKPFPGEDYILPEATDTLICCITWRKPISPGRYAFAMEAVGISEGVEISTNTLLIALDIPSILDVDNTNLIKAFTISPNPSSETLHLAWLGGESTPATLTVANTLGQVLLHERIDLAAGGEEVDVSGWPPGLYAVQIAAGGHVVTRKIIVQR